MKRINIVFCGTGDFALPTLLKLIYWATNDVLFKLVLVVTQPDKPKGRNLKIENTRIKEIALQNNIPVMQIEQSFCDEEIQYIKSFQPDMIVTVAFGEYLNKKMRTMCPYGAINLHPSLLPLHRGPDPIRSTILAKDECCGNTVFFLNAGIDAGNIILQTKYKIKDLPFNLNYSNLLNFLSEKGADDIVFSIKEIISRALTFKELKVSFPEQEHSKATFSKKINKTLICADFELSGDEFINRINAYSYTPGYYCIFRGKRLKLFCAEIVNSVNNIQYPIIKEIIKNKGFVITLKDSDLLIKEVQYENSVKMSAWQFNVGYRLVVGEKFEHNI